MTIKPIINKPIPLKYVVKESNAKGEVKKSIAIRLILYLIWDYKINPMKVLLLTVTNGS